MSIISRCQLGQINWFSGFGRRNKSFTVCRQKNEESGKKYIVSFFFWLSFVFLSAFSFCSLFINHQKRKNYQQTRCLWLTKRSIVWKWQFIRHRSKRAVCNRHLYRHNGVTIEGGQFCITRFGPIGRFVHNHQICQGLQVQSKSKNFCKLVEPVQTCSCTRKSNANVSCFFFAFSLNFRVLLFRIPIRNQSPCWD